MILLAHGIWASTPGRLCVFVTSDHPFVDVPIGNLATDRVQYGFGLVVGSAYLALEPWVRRRWPHAMITWARLLSGKWRDPVVCRDMLVAIACATASHAINGRRKRSLEPRQCACAACVQRRHWLLSRQSDEHSSDEADMILAFVRSLDVLMFFFVLLVARAVRRNNGERRSYTLHSGAWSWRLLAWSRGTGLSPSIGSSN